MAKGGNGKSQAKGHENANENFANGMCENGPPNDNAAKGLENALAHNPFECGTVIDFDSGINTVTYDYGYYVQGSYSQDGYTLDYYSYDYYYYYNAIGNPIHDSDGSGDNEFGYSDDGSGYNYYEYAGFTLYADDGSSFSLDSIDVLYQEDSDSYYYNYLQIYTYEYEDDGYQEAYAYTYDNETWYWLEYSYDYNTGVYDSDGGSTTDMDEVLALFDDQDYLYFYATDDFAVDNLELSDVVTV